MRQLATVQQIADIKPIEGADAIEVATVLGWRVVVKKGEFKVGSKCVYFEIDSWIPHELAPFLSKGQYPKVYDGVEGNRLKTMKLRGQLSQGLVLPVSILGRMPPVVGYDATELLNIKKWEAAMSAQLAGVSRGAFPTAVPKTDEPRIQSSPALLKEFAGRDCYWTIKCDGTSGTFVNIDGDHHVCSRNLSLKDVEGNTYWEIYYKYNLKEILDDNPNMAIQGEVVGEGIQKNTMKLKGHHLFVFNVYDIKAGRLLNYDDLVAFCINNKLDMVPLYKRYVFNYTEVDDLVEEATQVKYPCGSSGEGVVIRPVEGFYCETAGGRASFKVINNKYLLKHNE